jgi:cytochrome c2
MESKHMIRWLLVFVCFFALILPGASAQDGEALFKANCTSCHNMYKKVTGPALYGAVDRWEGQKEEMEAFIKNSQAYLKSGRPKSGYANKLYEEYNKTVMTAQALKPEEIQAIIGYIEKAPPPPTADAGGKKDTGVSVPVDALYSNFSTLIGILLLCSVLVVFGIAVVGYAIKAREEGKPLTSENFLKALRAFFSHRLVFTVIVLVVLVGAVNSGYRFLWMMNLHNGYQPVQPIAFSHKLHAGTEKGQLGIQCEYCHSGVKRGKSATIPAVSTCMNCHNVVEEGTVTGKGEIAKIREAYEKNKPIEWVRIHNLPDFVYFNHAQHVKVAGLECQECHGPIQEMEEVYQFSRLSMGWCIKCHREKEVDLNKSEYYKTVHANVKNTGDGKITVEKLGGTECARCHY